jgi:hypothetical protein
VQQSKRVHAKEHDSNSEHIDARLNEHILKHAVRDSASHLQDNNPAKRVGGSSRLVAYLAEAGTMLLVLCLYIAYYLVSLVDRRTDFS